MFLVQQSPFTDASRTNACTRDAPYLVRDCPARHHNSTDDEHEDSNRYTEDALVGLCLCPRAFLAVLPQRSRNELLMTISSDPPRLQTTT